MSEQSKKIKKILDDLGVQRISHRRPVRSETILSDLKDLAHRLGKPWPTKPKSTPPTN